MKRSHAAPRRFFAHAGVAIASSVLLAGIVVGAGRLWAAEPFQPDANSRLLTCETGAVQVKSVGVVINNAWNRASAGRGNWRQCLQSRQRNGVIEYGWFWDWPSRDGIYAYPEQMIGRSPWGSLPSNDPRFPRSIANIRSLQIDYDLESRNQGKKNLAVEFWLTDPAAKVPSADSIRAELMIWTDESPGMSTEAAVAGESDETIEIDGLKWAIRFRPDWGDASGGSSHKWRFITYRAVDRATTARYDARRIFQHAIEHGWLDARWQVEGVELGNEIVSGSGSTWIRRFDVEVD